VLPGSPDPPWKPILRAHPCPDKYNDLQFKPGLFSPPPGEPALQVECPSMNNCCRAVKKPPNPLKSSSG